MKFIRYFNAILLLVFAKKPFTLKGKKKSESKGFLLPLLLLEPLTAAYDRTTNQNIHSSQGVLLPFFHPLQAG